MHLPIPACGRCCLACAGSAGDKGLCRAEVNRDYENHPPLSPSAFPLVLLTCFTFLFLALLLLLLPLRRQLLLRLLCLCRCQGGIRACAATARLRVSS